MSQDSAPEPSSDPLPVVDELAGPCRHLRNKGMYVYSDGSHESHDDYDNTIYWCNVTMKEFGPDDGMVRGDDCRISTRSCYQSI